MTRTPACGGTCTTHQYLCDLDEGHPGDHECTACPGARARQRAEQIADRVAAHKALRDIYPTAPDED